MSGPNYEYQVLRTAVGQSGVETLAASGFVVGAGSNPTGVVQAFQRPTTYQQVDRWGNVTRRSDMRNPNWVTTFRYNANNQQVEQVQPDAAGQLSGSSPRTQTWEASWACRSRG